MIMSFDIRDDSKLLPIWDTLTNEEVLAVNQDNTQPVGTLVDKFSLHPLDAPQYLWAVGCNKSDAAQSGWTYESNSKAVKWNSMCLTAKVGQSLELANCSEPSESASQSWLLTGKRLWQASEHALHAREGAAGVGDLSLSECADPSVRPGQQWQYSLGDATTNVQVNLTTRMGGCWEITACAAGDGASVGTTYGCKAIPKGCKGSGDCTCNGAWLFNTGNMTITSVMSGKCLEARSNVVEVSACTGRANQQWKWADGGGKITGQISSKAKNNLCIDDGDFPAPAGTDGDCASLTHGDGGDGPGISLSNAGNRGFCDPSKSPKPTETFELVPETGAIHIGNGQCVAALRGKPSPYGPMQLWAKSLSSGAVAVLLANRGTDSSPAGTLQCDIDLLCVSPCQ
jgi:hypothetical protein